MKKLLTLAAVGLTAFAAQAQNRQAMNATAAPTRCANAHANLSVPHATGYTPLKGAKTGNATAFYTDTFSATSFTMTNPWVAGGNTPSQGSWKFTNTAATGAYNIGKIFSTTSAGGWMLYDSDGIGALFNSTPQVGTLTSPTISCAGHSYVGVRFQQYTERFQDTFYLQVSNNGGTTWTTYPIFPNMALTNNLSTENPEVTTINITATAANQANVKVRFYYSCSFAGGGYNWLVDDFQMLDLDPIDLGLIKSGAVMTLGGTSGNTPMGTMPKQFADTVVPFTSLINYGGLAQSGVTVSANIYRAGTALYPASKVFTSIPVNAYDSFAAFNNGYKSTTVGSYAATFSVNQTGDAVTANNTDTVVYNISDSSLCVFLGYQESTKRLNPYYYNGGYTVVGTGTPATKRFVGSQFEIPAGKRDTLTSLSVCFTSSTVAGAAINGEIYKLDDTDPNNPIWNIVGSTFSKTLTAGDISSTGALVFVNLPVNIGTNKKYVVADAGLYAAVIRPSSSSVSQAVYVAAARPAAPANLIGRYGALDEYSGTAGGFGLGIGTTYFTYEDVPAVVANFGNTSTSGTNPQLQCSGPERCICGQVIPQSCEY